MVFATHPPQTREIMADAMTDDERDVLSAFEYWPNDVIVHSDTSFLPRSKRAWASWNWYAETGDLNKAMLMLTYQLNTLQDIPARGTGRDGDTQPTPRPCRRNAPRPPGLRPPDVFGSSHRRPACRCRAIQGVDRVYFAGAWTRYGFHEDGMLSGVRVAEALGAMIPWGDQLDDSRTRVMPGAPTPMLGQTRKLMPGEQGDLALGRAAAVAGELEPEA